MLGRHPDAVVLRDELDAVTAGAHRDAAGGADAGVADRVRHQVLADHAQHPRAHRDGHVLVALDDQRHARAVSRLGEIRRGVAQRRKGEGVAERHDLTPRLELAEEEEIVDQLAHLLDLGARAVEEVGHVGVRSAARSRSGREGARAVSATRARQRR